MKIICSLLLFIIHFQLQAHDWEFVRRQYPIAVKQKELCAKMIRELEKKPTSALQLGYLGAFQTIWANHATNPFTKLATFKKGRTNLEKAIKLDNSNVELRWIRYNIQKNAPSFLGYNRNIEEDVEFIKTNRTKISSHIIQQQFKESGIKL